MPVRRALGTALCFVLIHCVLVCFATDAFAQRKKIFIDADVGGATGTDNQSMLILLQSPDVEVLGISIVSGDGWLKASTQYTLRMLELTGHGNVPVAMGAKFPLLNTRDETVQWEGEYGKFAYKGIWNDARPGRPAQLDPDVVPPLETGEPSLQPIGTHGVNFLIETVRKYPGEVAIWAGGPLTNLALAVRLDPELPSLAKELVMMGAGFNVDKGGNHRINGRREFNWWWDPEAVRIVMSSPWKKVTITPVDISVKTELSAEIKSEIGKCGSLTARYLTKYSRPGPAGGGGYMWDEISAMALIDPSFITRQQELYVNVDIDHGAGYGQTIFVEKEVEVPSWFWKLATVQWDLDTARFYRKYIDLMCRVPEGSSR